jgi:hypothetical protein
MNAQHLNALRCTPLGMRVLRSAKQRGGSSCAGLQMVWRAGDRRSGVKRLSTSGMLDRVANDEKKTSVALSKK